MMISKKMILAFGTLVASVCGLTSCFSAQDAADFSRGFREGWNTTAPEQYRYFVAPIHDDFEEPGIRITTYKTCYTCDGARTVTVKKICSNCDGDRCVLCDYQGYVWVKETCSTCEGTGKIKVVTER